MKKIGKILLKIFIVIFVLIAIAVAAVFVIFGKENVMAAIKGLTTSTEQLEDDIKKSDENQVQVLQDFGFNITSEDMEKIKSGEFVDEETIRDTLLGKNQNTSQKDDTVSDVNQTEKEEDAASSTGDGKEVDLNEESDSVISSEQDQTQNSKDNAESKAEQVNKDDPVINNETEKDAGKTPQADSGKTDLEKTEQAETKEPNQTTDNSNDDDSSEADEQIASLVAKMYVYKSQYTNSIASMVNTMYHQFYALPKEQQTYSSKVSIYNSYAEQIAAMEAQCDAQVSTLVSQLRKLLKESGRDESLADSLLAAYNTEKENSKAYHISRYAD